MGNHRFRDILSRVKALNDIERIPLLDRFQASHEKPRPKSRPLRELGFREFQRMVVVRREILDGHG